MKNLRITVNGTAYDVQVEELGGSSAPAGAQGSVVIKAPMPGTVVNVVVSAGQAVKAGDDLVFIEAMKMETPVKAPQDGTVATVDVAKGESVDSGKVLVTLN